MESSKKNEYISSLLEDTVVVQRVLAGEKELFEILLRRYNQRLYRVIRGYLKDPDEVQDAMQNAYLKAFDKLFQFRGNSSFSTWLIRIGINEALFRLQDMKKGRVVSLQAIGMDGAPFSQLQDKRMNPENALIRQEARQLLEQAIDHLPEKYRIVYILKEIEGLDPAGIMEALGLTETNVKVRLHRAKALLKDSLYQLTANGEVFEFGNTKCDAVTFFVMSRI